MEDLICPECGRPNLSEAKKCWYCQTELIRPSSEEDNNQPEEKSPQAVNTDISEKPQPQNETEEDIPEWLQKIRNRIEEDRDPEEELPYWKQKDIFGGEKKIKGKTIKEKKSQPAKKTTQPKLDIAEEGNSPVEKTQDDSKEDVSDELPDGFVKI